MIMLAKYLKLSSMMLFAITITTATCIAAGQERILYWNQLLRNNQFVELAEARAQAKNYNPFEINWLAKTATEKKHPILIFKLLKERLTQKNIDEAELKHLAMLILEADFQAGRDAEYLRLSQGIEAYKQAHATHQLLRTLTYRVIEQEYLAFLEQVTPFRTAIKEFTNQIQYKNIVTFGRDSNPRWMLCVQEYTGRIYGSYNDILVSNPQPFTTHEMKDFRELDFYKLLFTVTNENIQTWNEFFTTKNITTPFPEAGATKKLSIIEQDILRSLLKIAAEKANFDAAFRKQSDIKHSARTAALNTQPDQCADSLDPYDEWYEVGTTDETRRMLRELTSH